MGFRKIQWGNWWQLGELCEVPRRLLWSNWGIIVLCTMFLVSCVFFNKCLYFSYYVNGYFPDRPHISWNSMRMFNRKNSNLPAKVLKKLSSGGRFEVLHILHPVFYATSFCKWRSLTDSPVVFLFPEQWCMPESSATLSWVVWYGSRDS